MLIIPNIGYVFSVHPTHLDSSTIHLKTVPALESWRPPNKTVRPRV